MSDEQQSRKRIEIPMSEFKTIFDQIRHAIYTVGGHYGRHYIRREEVYIAMPEYMLKMLERYLIVSFGVNNFIHPNGKLEGCEIIPHYQNEIVVFYKHAVESEIAPIIIPIP